MGFVWVNAVRVCLPDWLQFFLGAYQESARGQVSFVCADVPNRLQIAQNRPTGVAGVNRQGIRSSQPHKLRLDHASGLRGRPWTT
jgi:hypothetical protein